MTTSVPNLVSQQLPLLLYSSSVLDVSGYSTAIFPLCQSHTIILCRWLSSLIEFRRFRPIQAAVSIACREPHRSFSYYRTTVGGPI